MNKKQQIAPPGQTFNTKHFLMRDLSAAEINKALDQTVSKGGIRRGGKGQRRAQAFDYGFKKLSMPGKGCGSPTPYPGTSSMSLIVPTNAHIVLEISDGPFQPVKVETYE